MSTEIDHPRVSPVGTTLESAPERRDSSCTARFGPVRRIGPMLAVATLAIFCAGTGSVEGAPIQRQASAVASTFAPPRLVGYRVAEHRRFDRVVFVFSGGLPGRRARYVKSVTADASGKPVKLRGRTFLQVTLMGVDWTVPNTPAEPTLTPLLAVLRQMKPAGVFEGYFSFGLGLSHRTTYRFSTVHHPDRLILDLDRN